jgi:hypothetical protein
VRSALGRQDPRVRDRMYGAVEYAKDGLLPLTDQGRRVEQVGAS